MVIGIAQAVTNNFCLFLSILVGPTFDYSFFEVFFTDFLFLHFFLFLNIHAPKIDLLFT